MLPDERGYFGEFGGRFVPETLVPALDQLIKAYEEIKIRPHSGRNSIHFAGTMSAGRLRFIHAEGLTRRLRRSPNLS